MNKPVIIIRPAGRMANQMLQLMFAVELSRKLGDAPVFGYNLPEWGIKGPKPPGIISLPDEMLLISKHRFNFNNLITLLKNKIVNGVVLEGWGMRLEHFGPRQIYQKLFQSNQKHFIYQKMNY